jgi:N-acetylmuramoyl-L-alanine amidase
VKRYVVLALIAALAIAAAPPRSAPRVDLPDTAPVRRLNGTPYIAVNDLARLLDATKFWKPELRKLSLRAGRHAITLTVDDPFVVVDETTLWLGSPVRSLRGELQVPVALADSLPSDSTMSRLYFDARHDRLIRLPASGRIGSPTLSVSGGTTRLAFPVDRPEEAIVVARSREHLRIRLGGLFTGSLPDERPAGSLLRDVHTIPSAIGTAFECAVSRDAGGFRLLSESGSRRVVLELTREALPGVEAFAPESAPGPRAVHVIVIDPGHGGSDPGVIAGKAVEKDLTLALARLLKSEIEVRMAARVILTRDADRSMTAEDRAEVANRSRADLVVSLHFDAFPAAQAHGATAYCAPATFVADARSEAARAGGAALVPWRDVAVRHAVQSRALAEAVLSALELRGEGPTRLRDRLPYAMLGVNAPGMLLECAALTSPSDRERVMDDAGLRDLASTIADGIQAWQRNQ